MTGSEEPALKKSFKKNWVESGTRQGGLNGYPLKQAGRGSKQVYGNGYLNEVGQGGAKPDPYCPIAILRRRVEMRSPTCGAAATRIRERKKRLTEGKIGFVISSVFR